MRRFTSLFLGAVLALTVTTSAFAATSTAISSESLNVLATVSITGVPATIDYGSSPSGATVSSSPMTIVVSTNNAAGFNFTLTATNLTGAGTIPSSARRINCTMTSAGTQFPGALCSGSDAAYPGGSNVALGATNAAGDATFATTTKVVIPGSAPAGAYSGTLTFTATTL